MLANDFFVNTYDINLRWEPNEDTFEECDYGSGDLKWSEFVNGASSLGAGIRLAETLQTEEGREE